MRRSRRGFTLLETMFATTIGVMVLATGIELTSVGARFFNGTVNSASAEYDVNSAARRIETTLATACDFTVDADGTGITYYLYNNAYPPHRDLTAHWFRIVNTGGVYNLMWSDQVRPVLKSVANPAGADPIQPYDAFFPRSGQAQNGNIITVTLIAQRTYGSGSGNQSAYQTSLIRVAARNYQQ